MKQDNSLVFFDYEEFEWKFVEDPKKPLGKHVGKAVRKSVWPFDDFTATITVHPRRDYPDSKLSFDICCNWWIDPGNHGNTSSNWPNYSDKGQAEDADLGEAMQHAYNHFNRHFSAFEYHLMP